MKTFIIDVREPYEYATDHAEGSINIPLGNLQSDSKLKEMAHEDQLIVYCASGNRSGIAINRLRQMGFSNLVNGINTANVRQNYTS